MMRRTLLALMLASVLSGCGARPDIKILSQAALQNDLHTVTRQLQAGLPVNSVLDDQDNTALHIAAQHAHTKIARYLLSQGANPYIRNTQGLSPIDLAIAKNPQTWAWAAIDKSRAVFDQAVKATRQHDIPALEQLLQSDTFYLHTYLPDEGYLLSHIAVLAKCTACIHVLGKAGFDLDRLTFNGVSPLSLAIVENNLQAVDTLLEAGANPSQVNRKNISALMTAVQTGNLLMINRLLKAGADVNQKNSDGWTALYYSHQIPDELGEAVQIQIVRALAQAGADLDAQIKNEHTHQYTGGPILYTLDIPPYTGDTLLHAALHQGQTRLAEVLLDMGANPDLPGDYGYTPLIVASYYLNLPMVKRLIQAGVNINTKDNSRWTALHYAAYKARNDEEAYAKIARLLIQAGAHINEQTPDGMTPLASAALTRLDGVAEALIQAGANLDMANTHGMTPLMIAIKNNDLKLVRRLLQSGADINVQDNDGATPLMVATQFQRAQLAEALLQAGANPDQADQTGWTPLMQAVSDKNMTIVQSLLKAGADVNKKQKDGASALHVTTEHAALFETRAAAIARTLIQAGADPNARNSHEHTPLHLAIMKNFHLMSSALLESGADPDLAYPDGSTPLMFAVSTGNLTLVNKLITAGADVNLKDKSGWTALHHSASDPDAGGGDEIQAPIARALIQAGAWVDSVNNELASPLHLAVAHDMVEVARVLLKNNANWLLRNRHGRNAAEEAIHMGQSRMLNLIINKNPDV